MYWRFLLQSCVEGLVGGRLHYEGHHWGTEQPKDAKTLLMGGLVQEEDLQCKS